MSSVFVMGLYFKPFASNKILRSLGLFCNFIWPLFCLYFITSTDIFIFLPTLAAALDSMASKTLAQVGKTFPVIKQTPSEVTISHSSTNAITKIDHFVA